MKLRIVSVNDVYRLDHLPRLRSLVLHHRTHDPADALLVTVAGDFLSPSLLSSLDAGRGMIECLDAVGVTHVTFGNHEDDLATEELLARVRELRARWLATNVRALDPSLPTHDVVDVAGARVGLVGVTMNDPAVYRRAPFGGGPIEEANIAALREATRLVDEERCAFVVALTHQFWKDDRALAAGQPPPSSARPRPLFPVILGGHEHLPGVETVGETVVVKTGAEAERAAVVDLTLDAAGRVLTEVRLEETRTYADDPEVRALVDRHLERVRALERATLVPLPDGEVLSSVDSRRAQTSLGTFVTSRLRDALGADAALLNGGALRGGREHEGALTYGALETEIPFDNEIVVVHLPGRVLADAIAFSRRLAPLESGAFLQVDDRLRVTDGGAHRVVEVAGAPLDPERLYRVATVRSFFAGLDRIEPLVAYADAFPDRIPPPDSGRGVRLLLVEAFAVALWRSLGGFAALDTDGDGRVTPAEVAAALARTPGQREPAVIADLVVRALDTLVVDRAVDAAEAARADASADAPPLGLPRPRPGE